MSEEREPRPLSSSQLQGPAEDFASYCEAAFERRRNSEGPFDEAVYREAMELTLERLRMTGEEGEL